MNAATPHRSDPAADERPGARGGIVLGHLFGVRIRVDWSLWIVFALVAFGLGGSLFPAWHPDWSPWLHWSVAIGAAVLFFASVLAHELSHAIVARASGVSVRQITLFLFGGVAHLDDEPPSPQAELRIALIGPVVSIVIGVVAWLCGTLLAAPAWGAAEAADDPAQAMAGVGPLATLLLWLGPVNVLLGVFNLVPGFPLDGGRVLRSLLWWWKGDLVLASRWAARAGHVVAWLLMGFGVWLLLAGGFLQGLWLILIGWFLNNAARLGHEQLLVRRALEGVSVRELMWRQVERVAPDVSVRELVDEHYMGGDQRGFPVEQDGRLIGLVCFDDLRRLPRDVWDATSVREIMTPLEELATLPPDADAQRALEQLARRDVEQIPVVQGRELVGLVRRRDIVKWLALRTPFVGAPHTQLAG